jgi:hypothetical protein
VNLIGWIFLEGMGGGGGVEFGYFSYMGFNLSIGCLITIQC